ncbi:MAG: response regulator [Pseudomonadales bacterium]
MSEQQGNNQVFDRRPFFLYLIVFICCLPFILNILGIDFSSVSTPLKDSAKISADQLFYAVAGAMHHALLEWSAFTLAVLAALCSYIHYWLKRDIIVPIMGTALLAAGCVDAFHTLAATRIIQANAPNTDFIPFTWALSRIFNATIIILGALVSIWIMRQPADSRVRRNELQVLVVVSLIFIVLAYAVVHIAAVSGSLPRTMYPNAMITRPFDVLPLALFGLAGALYWAWYKQAASVFKYALLLSIFPEVVTQLHMAFGSVALFDNHFNIAHSIKVLAYGCVFVGVIIDLAVSQRDAHYAPGITDPDLQRVGATIDLDDLDDLDMLEVGVANRPLGIKLPLAGFGLCLTVAIVVGTVFYLDTERLTVDKSVENLRYESKLVEPLLTNLYKKTFSDVAFLSNTPPINGIINSIVEADHDNLQRWRSRLEIIFLEILKANDIYKQVRYIGIDDGGREIVSVIRQRSGVTVVPTTQLERQSQESYFLNSIDKNRGTVSFSNIKLDRKQGSIIKPLLPVLRVATPVFNTGSGAVFGIVIIDINFGQFINNVVKNTSEGGVFYLANEEGDYLVHPDESKIYSAERGFHYRMQEDFPELAASFAQADSELDIRSMFDKSGIEHMGVYTLFTFPQFDNPHPLRLLLQYETDVQLAVIQELRNRGIILGVALAFVALALSILASRQVINPLTAMTNGLEVYEKTGRVGALPIAARDEIGVLARSFQNLLTRVEYNTKQQREVAIEIEESRATIQAIVNSAAEGIVSIDPEGIVLSFNRAAASIFGYREEEVVGQPIDMLMPLSYRESHGQNIINYLRSGRSTILGVSRELQGLRKNAETFPIALSVSEVRVADKRIFTGLIRDISQQQQLESDRQLALETAEELSWRMEFALTAPGIGVWDLDLVSDELIWDKRMYEIYGVDPKSYTVVSDSWKVGLLAEDHDEVVAQFNNSATSGKDFSTEFRIAMPSGEIKHIAAYAKVLKDANGRNIRMVGTNQDVTEYTRLQTELHQALKKSQESAQLKSEFLASMSHEIRTPMNAVLGMLGLLLKGTLDNQQQHYASLARSSAKSLLTLINDILDFSKIEAGKLDLELIDFDLSSQLGEFAEAMALRGQAKGLEVVLDITGIDRARVKGDPGRIRQVLTNLVGNAIKFTASGEVLIKAELCHRENDLQLKCQVKDTGIGIPEEKQKTLFDAFIQVDASTTRKHGGTGLGLAIARQLCDIMGGDISVHSELGKGSCFEFTLSLQPSNDRVAVLPIVDLTNTRILIVDDNETNREVLRGQLELWGALVTEAIDGPSALRVMEEQQQAFPVAILDMRMPGMDGAELGRTIRADSRFDDTRLIMMTSLSGRGDAEFFADIGFSAYFPKPATLTDLHDALAVVLTGGAALETAKPLVTHHHLRSLVHAEQLGRILLVEDNHINQEVALGILEHLGYTTGVASNGIEAIKALRNAPDGVPYQLVLMDCQMPELDGYATTRRIRSGVAEVPNQAIPIIAMTANAMRGNKEKCLNAGMSDYLAKPIDEDMLDIKLKQWLSGPAEKSQESDDMMSDIASVRNDNTVNDGDKPLQVWDKDDALSRLRGRVDRLMMLAELFPDETASYMENLQQAVDQGDNEQARAIAHTLKGVAGTLSAQKLQAVAERMEHSAAAEDSSTVSALFPDLQQQYQHFSQLLEQDHAEYKMLAQEGGDSSAKEVIDLNVFLPQLADRLQEGDYIDPAELNKISALLTQAEAREILEGLRVQISCFDIEGALKSIKALGTFQDIAVKM